MGESLSTTVRVKYMLAGGILGVAFSVFLVMAWFIAQSTAREYQATGTDQITSDDTKPLTEVADALVEIEQQEELEKAIAEAEADWQALQEDEDYQRALAEMHEREREAEFKADYIRNHIRVYDVQVRYRTPAYENHRVPGIVFKLQNKGDRSLDEVEITFYFKDENGTVIYEEDFHPVLVTEYGFGDNNKPLKPGYIWQMEPDTFYSAPNVPSEWKEYAATYKITEIRFSSDDVRG